MGEQELVEFRRQLDCYRSMPLDQFEDVFESFEDAYVDIKRKTDIVFGDSVSASILTQLTQAYTILVEVLVQKRANQCKEDNGNHTTRS